MNKLQQSIDKAKELIEGFKSLNRDDFWELQRKNNDTNKLFTVAWIMSHNGCLKIANEKDIKLSGKFEVITNDKNDVVVTYSDPDNGIFEIGEASPLNNAKNVYPYAMALKRCQDRAILKITGLAYQGVYSDTEADDFKKPEENKSDVHTEETIEQLISNTQRDLDSADTMEKLIDVKSYIACELKDYFTKRNKWSKYRDMFLAMYEKRKVELNG